MVKNKVKVRGKWSRDHHPRPKFITTSVTVEEYEQAHICAKALNLSISAWLRQVIADQYYLLQQGKVYKSPILENKLDLGEVE
jgi:hypothetical protein